MRYWIGFLVAVALVAVPVVGQGQGPASVSKADIWLWLQLNEPDGLCMPSAARPSLAYIPEHLKQRQPGYRHHATPTTQEGLDSAVKSEREIDIQYTTPGGTTEESGRGLSRRARIAIGVVVPVVFVTGVAAAVTVSAFNNMFDDL